MPSAAGDTGAVAVAQLFEKTPADLLERRAALAAAGALTLGDAAPQDFEPIAVPEPLATLLPGGIRRGEALALSQGEGSALSGDGADAADLAGSTRHGHGLGPASTATRPTRSGSGPATASAAANTPFSPGAVDYLSLALLAGALRQGLWCAAVGVPGLGGAALAGLLGAAALREGALQRLLVVTGPGERWAEIAAVLADGVDLVLLAPAGPVPAQLGRRLDARLRQGSAEESRHRAALLVLGAWPGARTALRVRRLGWRGLDRGVGRLIEGDAVIGAEDRSRRLRTVRVRLPDDLGAAAPLAGLPGRGKERPVSRLTAVA
jgi:hypothetical protein